jgi:hypothetical protein
MVGIGGRTVASRRTLRTAIALLVLLACPSAAGASVGESADQAQTRAYLQAATTLDQALAVNARASDAGAEAFSARLTRECPGVLARSPQHTAVGAESSPRERGIAARREVQLTALRLELLGGYSAAALAPDAAAIAAFRQTVIGLHWSDPAVTQLATQAGAWLAALAQLAPRDVCADLRAWVVSGYTRLAAGVREAGLRVQAPVLEAFTGLLAGRGKTLAARLERYEDGSLRTLADHAAGLAVPVQFLPGHGIVPTEGLGRALGLSEPNEAAGRAHGMVVGAGLTDADGRFLLRIERSRESGCKWIPNVEYGSTADFLPSAGVEPDSHSSCRLVGPATKQPNVSCFEDEDTIEVFTSPAVRRVRLRLASGRNVTSPVLRVPRRAGGPAGIYYQVIRGTAQRPTRLTELGAGGRVLKVTRLRYPGCSKEPTFPPPVEIASGATPDGTAFQIVGRYESVSASGRLSDFGVGLAGPFQVAGLSDEENEDEPDGSIDEIVGPFQSSLRSRCGPPEAAVVFGLLSAPADTILARTGAGLTTLAKVALPPSLHMHAVAAYGSFAEEPTEVIVRDATGKTLASRDLSRMVATRRQFCEAYDEP